VTAALSTRETELANMRQQVERARRESARQAADAELTTARAAWNAEFEKRLAQATAKLEQSRAAWQAETEDRLARIVAQAETHFKDAEVLWRGQSQHALAQAAEAWRSEEATRLAAAEAEWREKTTCALAAPGTRFERAEAALKEARDQPEAVAEQGGDELHRLRKDLIARLLRSADNISQV
jgi:hypothetical protein